MLFVVVRGHSHAVTHLSLCTVSYYGIVRLCRYVAMVYVGLWIGGLTGFIVAYGVLGLFLWKFRGSSVRDYLLALSLICCGLFTWFTVFG